jgi:hypothetical protein
MSWPLFNCASGCSSVADPDPHQTRKLDPDPHQSGKLDPDQSDKQRSGSTSK